MDKIFSAFNEVLPLFTAGGAVILAARVIPRIGPGRALTIALRSRFASKPNPESLRVDEIKVLRSMIAEKNLGQGYLVVTGEKGVGKTCLLNTVTSKTPGVIKVEAQPQESNDMIIKNVLRKLTNMPFDFIPPFDSAERVISWHRRFTFGRSPIVIINATERTVGHEYAGLTGAVRTLVDKYNLRVVVDGSPNSLDESLLRTKREDVIDIKPMTKEMIWQIEQLQDFFKYVKKADLDDTVFAVLGGIPADYEKVWRPARIELRAGGDPREVIGARLCAAIHAAITIVQESKKKGTDMEEIIKLFGKEKAWIQRDTLIDKKLERPSPDKVFRKVERNGVNVLIPASNAIGIVLKHSLSKKPTLDELEKLLKNKV